MHAESQPMIRRNRAQATPNSRPPTLRSPEDGDDPHQMGAAGATVAQRRGPSIKTILLLALLLILILTAVGGILLWQRVAAFNESVSTAPAASSALWGPLGGEERINIALFGYGGKEHKSGNYLADSIQIISIDPKADTTTIIPVPRDFWIEGMPQLPANGKVNEVFAVGWQQGGVEKAATLSVKVLSEATGLEIDHWMAIDFEGFREVIDAVGGVTINNPRAFRYTWNEWKYSHNVWDFRFEKGRIDLNGEQALDFARARYTNAEKESSDFARAIRQQRVLRALRDKIGPGGFGSLGPGLAMMDALAGRMKTDLSAIDLFLLSGRLQPDKRIELKEGRILEATGNTIGQYILVVVGRADSTDYTPLHNYLRRQLAKPIPQPSQGAESSGSP
jgi:LCP family protein required for cell wall assembly